jgi:hypothetical protein
MMEQSLYPEYPLSLLDRRGDQRRSVARHPATVRASSLLTLGSRCAAWGALVGVANCGALWTVASGAIAFGSVRRYSYVVWTPIIVGS